MNLAFDIFDLVLNSLELVCLFPKKVFGLTVDHSIFYSTRTNYWSSWATTLLSWV